MGVFSEEELFGMTIRESATDGSDFTNPAADYRRLFLGEDGQLHVKDSAGAVTAIGGGNAFSTTIVYRATDQNVDGSGTQTPISWSNEVEDTDGVWAIGTPTKFVIPSALNGRRAIIYGHVQWSASTSGNYRHASIFKSGTAIAQNNVPDHASAFGVDQQVISKPLTLATADEFILQIRTDTTGIGAIGGEHLTWFVLYTVD